jgi:fructan beta-fructosidase
MKKYTLLYFLLVNTYLLAQNDVYSEPHRPQFHFSPVKNWMNDPNGLVFYEGEYHLFYQYYPDSTVWGPMHWGHAVSKDLIHWEHLPIALYPDSNGCIFSGSAVIDEKNTSGFAREGSDYAPMVAIFTYHNLDWEREGRLDRESQGIAFSLDKGRTWTKYAQNPVLKNKGDVDFRDPKVFWHEPTKRWVMSLAVGDHIEIFNSTNLKDWSKTSDFGKNEGAHGGVWECPDLFAMPTPEGEKWVLLQNMGRGAVNGGSGTQYFVGQFDGLTFKNDNAPNQVLWLDYGADNYAGVTWNGTTDGRKIFIGWMSNWDDYATKVPTTTWRSAMTVPRTLSLEKTLEGFRLVQNPVEELTQLRSQTTILQSQKFNNFLTINNLSIQKEINLTFDLKKSSATELGFLLSNTRNERLEVGYDKVNQLFYIDRTEAGKKDFSAKFARIHSAPYKVTKTLTIRALIDASSVEIFVDNGKLAMTEVFFPNEDFKNLNLFAKKGKAKLAKGEVHTLKGIWNKIH